MKAIAQKGRVRHEQSWQRTPKTAFTRDDALRFYKNLANSPYKQLALLPNGTCVTDKAFDITTNVNDVTCGDSKCAVFCFKLEVKTGISDKDVLLDGLIEGTFRFLENKIAAGQSLSISAACLDPSQNILLHPNPIVVEVAVMIEGIAF
jgi:hypothetical protein